MGNRWRRIVDLRALVCAALIIGAALAASGASASSLEDPVDAKLRRCEASLADLKGVMSDVDALLKKARRGDIYIVRNGSREEDFTIVDADGAFRFLRLFWVQNRG